MTKLKNVRIVILKVLTHVRTHPEELLVSKIWISCFLFRLRFSRFEEIVWRKEAGGLGKPAAPHFPALHCAKKKQASWGKHFQHKHEAWHCAGMRSYKQQHGIAQAWGVKNMALRRLGLKNNKTKNSSLKVLRKRMRFGGKKRTFRSTENWILLFWKKKHEMRVLPLSFQIAPPLNVLSLTVTIQTSWKNKDAMCCAM